MKMKKEEIKMSRTEEVQAVITGMNSGTMSLQARIEKMLEIIAVTTAMQYDADHPADNEG